MSPQEVYRLARGQQLSHAQAVIATAIAMGESSLNPGAVGDTALVDAKWGPSIGLWQIRSLKAESGTGRSRDANQLKNPAFNARSMASISSRGTSWSPWSVYNSGAYRTHIGTVERAVGNGSSLTPPTPSGPGSNNPLGVPTAVAPFTLYPGEKKFWNGIVWVGSAVPEMVHRDGTRTPLDPSATTPSTSLTTTTTSGDPSTSTGPVGLTAARVGLPDAGELMDTLVKGLLLAAGVGVGVTLVAIGAWRAVSGSE